MKAALLKLFAPLFLLSLAGCSNGDGNTTGGRSGGTGASSLNGSYDLITMVADRSVDLNNDGIGSQDLLQEIDPAIFETDKPELEIKSILFGSKVENMINFVLPHTSKIIANTPQSHGSATFDTKPVGFTYQYNKDTKAISINNGSGTTSLYDEIVSIQILPGNRLMAVYIKKYYDFITSKWIPLNITCVYQKK